MNQVLILLPIALLLGLVGLVAFVWSLKTGQYDDLEGASMRILDDEDRPLADKTNGPKNGDESGKNQQSI